MSWAVFVEGLESLNALEKVEGQVAKAAAQAINKTARDSRTSLARRIRGEINVPANYLRGDRFSVTRSASPGNLEARITARGRPTSLARFVTGSPKRGAGVNVEVSPGQARFMRRAFLIRLPQGNALTDTKFNQGLAIRLRPGETLTNKKFSVRMNNGLYLLYGPSVSQVFLANDGSGVAKEQQPQIEARLQREFLRLLRL